MRGRGCGDRAVADMGRFSSEAGPTNGSLASGATRCRAPIPRHRQDVTRVVAGGFGAGSGKVLTTRPECHPLKAGMARSSTVAPAGPSVADQRHQRAVGRGTAAPAGHQTRNIHLSGPSGASRPALDSPPVGDLMLLLTERRHEESDR